MTFCIGLTGGIGCGKSTVAHLFAESGAAIIDTDAISHTLTQSGAPGFLAIMQHFGPRYQQADGTLDRGKLRTLIFSDADAKQKLESILHPLIYAEVLAAIQACTAPYAVIVVPLLFETGNYLPLVQRTLVVDCAESTQIARTKARSGLSETDTRAITAHQLDRTARIAHADDVIHNENGLNALRQQVAALHARYFALAAQTAAKS